MFNSVAVWRALPVLQCGCLEGEANTIIIILLSDSLDKCTVGFAYLYYSLRGNSRVLSPDIMT